MNHKKKFGVWMNSQHATIASNDNGESKEFSIVGTVKREYTGSNSNENTGNNHEQGAQTKFFKKIATYLTNAEEVHITGTGTEQEHFKRFLSETPEFKKTQTEDSTSNEMSDEKLLEFFAKN